MSSPASDPAVPGATGAKPQPNQVPMRNAPVFRRGRGLKLMVVRAFVQAVVFEILRLHGRRDHVFLAGPIPQVDQLAALAAKRIERVIGRNFLFADGALHRIARMGNASFTEAAASVSVGASSVPIRS